MQELNRNFEIVSCYYQTPELIKKLYDSVRNKLGAEIKITILNNSDLPKFSEKLEQIVGKDEFVKIQKGNNTTFHHGRGMDKLIRESKYEFQLILDSDGEIIDGKIIDKMFSLYKKGDYGVGEITNINPKSGANIDMLNEYYEKVYGKKLPPQKSIKYLHPRCVLINKSEYLKYKAFIKHGTPCIDAMNDIHDKNKTELLINFLDIEQYFKEKREGTRSKFGIQLNPEALINNKSETIVLPAINNQLRIDVFRNHKYKTVFINGFGVFTFHSGQKIYRNFKTGDDLHISLLSAFNEEKSIKF